MLSFSGLNIKRTLEFGSSIPDSACSKIKSIFLFAVYLSPIADVRNYHKPGDLKQQSLFYYSYRDRSPKLSLDWNQESAVLGFLRSLRKNTSTSGGYQLSLVCGHITNLCAHGHIIFSASVIKYPSDSVRTLLIEFKATWMIQLNSLF